MRRAITSWIRLSIGISTILACCPNSRGQESLFGGVRPGVEMDFEAPVPYLSWLRDPAHPTPTTTPGLTPLSFKVSTPITLGATCSTEIVSPLRNKLMPSRAWIVNATTGTLTSERIDIRAHTDLSASFVLDGYSTTGNLSGQASLTAFIQASTDGISFNTLPWFAVNSIQSPPGMHWQPVITDTTPKRAKAWDSATAVPASTWRAPAFDDSSWPQGTKGAGYEASPGSSTEYVAYIDRAFEFLSLLQNKPGSIVMRIPFNVPADLSPVAWRFFVRSDDGYVAWLDGIEVARTPNVPVAPAWNSRAGTAPLDEDVILGATTIIQPTTPIAPGNHLLTLHAFNQAPTGSDFLIQARLDAGTPSAPSLEESLPSTPLWHSEFSAQFPVLPAGTSTIRIALVIQCQATAELMLDRLTFNGTAVPNPALPPLSGVPVF